MARTFVSASSQYLEGTAPLTAYPFTLAVWFASTAPNQAQLSLGISTGTNRAMILLGAGGVWSAGVWDTSNVGAISTTVAAYNDGAWHHGAGVYASATSRIAYADGAAAAENTTSMALSGMDRLTIGARYVSATRGLYYDGKLAEAAIWNIALSATDVATLARRLATPLAIRRDALVGYWPLFGQSNPEPDYAGGRTQAVTGATRSDHPPVAVPWVRPGMLFQPAAATPPLAAQHYRRRRVG